jgi:methylaspartate mutase epsilon subunit
MEPAVSSEGSVGSAGAFHRYVERQRKRGALIVQPRMGFSAMAQMRRGLEAVRGCELPRIGTITVDSFTRLRDFDSVREALRAGKELNGYPIASRTQGENRALLSGLLSDDFPIQVRHGSASPEHIINAAIEAGLDATEGGPVSYCLPYSRVPLGEALAAWGRACRRLAELERRGVPCHLESFGGCMLGQLCPPSLLIALTILEGLFSRQHGIRSLSLSLAQGTSAEQDVAALLVLRKLAARFLADVSWHVVFYTFMGKFPETPLGARRLIEASAHVAVSGHAERLIVKTAAEAKRVPTIEDNIAALHWAHDAAVAGRLRPIAPNRQEQVILEQATFLVEMVLDLSPTLDRSIELAFQRGFLDVPHCLHPDNRNATRATLDDDGNINWARTGNIPFANGLAERRNDVEPTSKDLLGMLSYNQSKFDGAALPSVPPEPAPAPSSHSRMDLT